MIVAWVIYKSRYCLIQTRSLRGARRRAREREREREREEKTNTYRDVDLHQDGRKATSFGDAPASSSDRGAFHLVPVVGWEADCTDARAKGERFDLEDGIYFKGGKGERKWRRSEFVDKIRLQDRTAKRLTVKVDAVDSLSVARVHDDLIDAVG